VSLGQRLISANNTPVSISYIGTNSKTAFTLPQTFSSVSLGSAGFVIVGVIGQETGTLTGVSVGGNACSLLYESGSGIGSFWYGVTPGGTGNVVLSGSSASMRMAIAQWNVNDFVNDELNYTGYALVSGDPHTITPTGQPEKGWSVLAMTQPGNTNGFTAWTNMTQHWDANFTGASSRPYSVASTSVVGTTSGTFTSDLSSTAAPYSHIKLLIR